MDDKEFEALINDSIDNLPREFLEKLENIIIVFQDLPSNSQMNILRGRENERHLLLGLYEGIPKTKRTGYGIGGQLPDKITIFKKPILMISQNSDDVKANVKETVIHEIAHHFGMSDEEIHKIR